MSKSAASLRYQAGFHRLLPFLLLLALWAGARASGATSAVVTFTNFPAAVSNTYNGLITLQIYGMTNGVTNVVVQKFLDLNTNGAIDSGDLLVQQFRLTAGQAPVFTNGVATVTVTNFMPGDVSSIPGQITTPLNFQNGDFAQNIVGHYLYKVSSPSGQFSPVTNLFVVTNTTFSSVVTGSVQDGTTFSNIPNAIVLLFSIQGTELNVAGSTMANSSGGFILRAPVGTYVITAAKSNYVGNLSSEVVFSQNYTNVLGQPLSISPSFTNILGRVVNSTNRTLGLPGLSGFALDTNSDISLYFSDTNGNFTAPVVSDEWTAPVDNFAATFAGYLTLQANQAVVVSNKAVNVTNLLPRAMAIFYGIVTNNSGGAMPGVYIYAADNAGHQSEGMTDAHGNYVLDALGETNSWQIYIPPTGNPGLTNSYVVSPGFVQTNINAGQAIQQNFVLAAANNTISGTVQDVDGNPIGGIVVFATATNINGVAYQAFNATTAANGSYSLNVVTPGNWTVGLSTNSLASLGYQNFPADQSTNLAVDANATINFTILVCGEIQILTTNLPDAMLGSDYETNLLATSCYNITNWTTAYGITLTSLYDHTNLAYLPGTAIYSDSKLVGYLESDFSFGYKFGDSPYFTNMTGSYRESGDTYYFSLSASVNVSAPITNTIPVVIRTVTWYAQPTTQNGSSYTTTLTNYSFSALGTYSSWNYTVTNGVLMTKSTGTSNTVARLESLFHSQPSAGFSMNTPSSIAFTGTNNTVVWIQKGTNLPGQYFISPYGPQSTNLPPGMYLESDGIIHGTPTSLGTNNGVFNFTVAAIDEAANATVQPLTLVVDPATNSPSLESSKFNLSSNVFQMQFGNTVAGENYSLLMTTNLSSTNWIPIFTTNAVNDNGFVIPDVHATNPARFYRLQMTP